jgi:cell division protein FtsN
MRFEVKGGGITAIVLAMALLSSAVFVMGLLAGYDVGRQAQLDMAQLATSYPLQAAPSSGAASNSSPAAPANPAAPTTASPATAPSPADRSLATESVSPQRKPSQSSATPARKRIASSSIPSATEPSSTATDEDIGAAAESETSDAGDESSEAPSKPDLQSGRALASTAPSVRHKPYNIQIEAAMDISGADQMMARLRKLGYPSHLVPTEIAGQRWYKVEVGPYATAEEASSTEAQLRQKYDSTYGGAGSDNSAGETSAGDNSEE